MKKPGEWREAILARAVDTDSEPEVVMREFLPYITDPPRTCSKAEARRLAKRYPFGVKRIRAIFDLDAWAANLIHSGLE